MSQYPAKRKCGFIGLGDQGAPIARRMVEAGFPLVLWARRPEALTPFGDTAATTADSIADLASRADHVGICVVDDAGVRSVCTQLFPAMKAGGTVVIHATIHPDTCRALAADAAARGLALIDAPVSGGGARAAAGTLTVMIGGDAPAVAAARPVFETFASLIVHLGDVGAGQQAKLINNSLMAANTALAHSAFQAGAALGIDRAALAELLCASSGRSYGLEVYAHLPDPRMLAQAAVLLAKDVGLLDAVLPDDPGADTLVKVATPFLDMVLQLPPAA